MVFTQFMSLSLFYGSPTIPDRTQSNRMTVVGELYPCSGRFVFKRNRVQCLLLSLRSFSVRHNTRIRIIRYIHYIFSLIHYCPSKVRAFITVSVVCFLPAIAVHSYLRSPDYILLPSVVYLKMAVLVPVCARFLWPSYSARLFIPVPNVRSLNAPQGRRHPTTLSSYELDTLCPHHLYQHIRILFGNNLDAIKTYIVFRRRHFITQQLHGQFLIGFFVSHSEHLK